jgi:hypothetical protein
LFRRDDLIHMLCCSQQQHVHFFHMVPEGKVCVLSVGVSSRWTPAAGLQVT